MRPDAGDLIRRTRESRGLTQAQLAARAHTAQSAISRLEQGHVSPTVRQLAWLVEAMGDQLLLIAHRPSDMHFAPQESKP